MARPLARLRPPAEPPPAGDGAPAMTPARWARINTGAFEQELEAHGRLVPAQAWSWPRIGLGVAVGVLFAVVNQYVGLRTGLIVFGSWYVVLMVGLARRWTPAEINLAAVAGGGANFIVGGYAYVLPALYLLSAGPSPLLAVPGPEVLAVAAVATVLAGVLGAAGFSALRRAWLVEHPLPYPSFEQYLELLALAQPAPGPRSSLRRAGKLLGLSGLAAGAWTFVQQFPLRGGPLLAPLEAGGWYGRDIGLQQPLATAQLTWLNLSLSPLLVATGWFMRLRVALIITAGSAVAWLLVVPLAVLLGVPASDGTSLATLALRGQPAALLAFQGPVRALAAGAIVGGGLAAAVRLRRLLLPALASSLRLRAGGQDSYEGPPRLTGLAAAACLVILPLLLLGLGAPPLAAVVVGMAVVAGTLLLGAVAVKVAGETSLEPASATGFILVLFLALVLPVLGLTPAQAALFAILGAAAFFAGVTMMGNLLLDMKIALYVGNPPRSVLRAALLGIVPGALVGGLVAALLGPALASGVLALPAPQARAYATLLTAGFVAPGSLALVALGAAAGVFVEWRTGHGAAFGLGMFLPLGIPGAFVLGAALREGWEKRAARRAWAAEERDLARADTYLVATGLMVGEALVGTAAALTLALGFGG